MQSPKVFVICDLGKDYDDLAAIILLKELHRLGLIHLEGVITNMNPPRKRAILGRTILDLLDLQDVPIGVGTAGPPGCGEAYDYEFEASFMPEEEAFTRTGDRFFEDGSKLLHQVFTRSIEEGRQVELLLISPLGDIVNFAELHPNIFRPAVGRIHMQGRYSVSAKDVLIPGEDATNNFMDKIAARKFHKLIGEQKIPSVVYTKVAACAVPIPADIFKDLEASEHPIGSYIRNCHIKQNKAWYETACSHKPFKNITQERFLLDRTNFYQQHPPGPLRSIMGTPLPFDGTPLPIGDQILRYSVGIIYDALAAFDTCGQDAVQALGVLDTESMAAQTSIYKVVGTTSPEYDLPDIPNINPERMELLISTLLKGALNDCTEHAGRAVATQYR